MPPVMRPRRTSLLLCVVAMAVFALFYALLSLGPCVVAGGSSCYHGYRSAYSFDAGAARADEWMAALRDDAPLSALSIPGTHDTMTYAMTDNPTLQCQNWNLTAQMRAGLRYFDIRARLRAGRLHIYHGDGDTGFGLEDVLVAMFAFLDEHPSEALVVRLKKEAGPVGDDDGSVSFEDAFDYHRLRAPRTAAGAAKHLALYDGERQPIPTLGALRSKIFLLQQFKAERGPYGLLWEGPQMALEDLWIIPDVYHLPDKFTAIRDALERAATAPPDNKLLYLAHLSASVGVLPIQAAAGPKNRTIDGMNDMTGQWLRDFESVEGAARTGIVIIDFPGRRLIDAVLRWNKPLMKG